MSRAAREDVFAALFAVLQGAYNWQTVSRRLKNVQDLQPTEFPAAYQVEGNQTLTYAGGMPTVNEWDASWLLYAYNDDPNVAPSTQLNAMVDAVLAALAPSPASPGAPLVRNTLGGLVEYAAASGNVEIFEGFLDGNRAIAIIPIKIRLGGF